MNIIIRKQWIEHEKLSYPLTVMPVEVIGNTSKLFSNKFIWISFGLAFTLEILAGFNFLYPIVPALKAKYIIQFTEKPWNTIGWGGAGTLPVYVYPFAIGFGYLMPLDLSLSLWLFFLFWQAQDVFFNATGWTTASALCRHNSEPAHGSASELWLFGRADAISCAGCARCLPAETLIPYIRSPSSGWFWV